MKTLHVFTLLTTPESFFDGQFKYLAEQGHELHLAASPGVASDGFLERNHLKFHPVAISRRIALLDDLKTIVTLCRLIRQENFDCVVGHTPKGALTAMLAGWLCKVRRRIYYRHGLIYTTATGGKRFVLKTVEQITSLLATKIVNVSHSLSRLAVREHLNPASKQLVLGAGTCGGIDTINLFNPVLIDNDSLVKMRHDFGLDKTDYVVGFVGRICKDKGIRELLDAFLGFIKTPEGRNAKLLLVGHYDERDVMEDRYRMIIENHPSVVCTGNVARNDIAPYYALMDVFVFPSYREGFGMSVIEAGAMGVPALVSRSHGCEDSITEHVTGEFIPIHPDGIREALCLFHAKTKREKYSSRCRTEIVSKYEQTILWPSVLEIYKD